MATTKPRITVTLTERQHEVLRVISACGGQPMSTFIGEMLEAALPTLERMAATFQKIKQAQEQERARFLESMDEAQAAIEPVVMQAVGQFDLFLGKIDQALEGRGDPAAGGVSLPSSASGTPVTNRGVTPSPGKSPKPAPRKASSPVRTPRSKTKKSGG